MRTALRLVDEHGLPALTMRALATELQVSPMALYNHVRDKNELINLLADLMLGEVDLPTNTGDWTTQLRALACSIHQVLTTHPGLARVYSTKVRIGPHSLRIMERGLGLLRHAGFRPPDTTDAFFALFTYTAGYHQMGRVDPRDYSALPPEQIPSITTVTAHLNGVHQQGQFEYGLNTLAHRPENHPQPHRTPPHRSLTSPPSTETTPKRDQDLQRVRCVEQLRSSAGREDASPPWSSSSTTVGFREVPVPA